MAAQTKTYQVKFETKGFSQIAEAFGSINAGISKTQKNFQNLKYKPNLDRPRNQLGQFTDQSQLKLEFELKRLNRSLERLNNPLQKITNGFGQFVENVRPKSQAEILNKQFDTEVSKISADSRGLAKALRAAMKEQNLEIAKAIESSGGSRSPNPLDIAGGALSSLTKTVFMPIEATLFGTFQEIGASLSRDFGVGLADEIQKTSKIGFKDIGKDIGQAIGKDIQDTVLDIAKFAEETIGSENPDALKSLKALGKRRFTGIKNTFVRASAVVPRSYQRMQEQRLAVPNIKQRAGEILNTNQLSQEEIEKIEKAKSITLAVGGAVLDNKGEGHEYLEGLTEPMFEGTHMVGVKNPWTNSPYEEDFKKRIYAFSKNALSNEKTRVPFKNFLKQNLTTGDDDISKTLKKLLAEKETDIDAISKTLSSFEEVGGKSLESFFKGFNPDDVEIAAQAIAYREQFPDKPINIVGQSYGGINVAGALRLLESMGVSNVKGVGLTTPFSGILTPPNSDTFFSSIGTKDPLYRETSQLVEPFGFPKEFEQVIQGAGSGHFLAPYMAHPEFQGRFQEFMSGRLGLKKGLDVQTTGYLSKRSETDPLVLKIVESALNPDDDLDVAVDEISQDIEFLDELISDFKKKARKIKDGDWKKAALAYVGFLETLSQELSGISLLMEQGEVSYPEESLEKLKSFFKKSNLSSPPPPPPPPPTGVIQSIPPGTPGVITPEQQESDQQRRKRQQETDRLILEQIEQERQKNRQPGGSMDSPPPLPPPGIVPDLTAEQQETIEKAKSKVLQNSAADFTDLRKLRAQLGLPAQAQKGGLSTRYNDRVQQLMSGARASAQQRIRGMIPGFQELDPKQRAAELKKMRSGTTQGLTEFRSTMAKGDQNEARKLGEGLLQRIEAIRVAADDLTKNFTGDKRVFNGLKSQLKKQSKEIQVALEGIAKNATGSLADAIESDLGSVEGAGEAIGESLIGGAEDSLEIRSPSKAFQRIGEQVVAGFRLGTEDLFELNLPENIDDSFGNIDEFLGDTIGELRSQFDSLLQQVPVLNTLIGSFTKFGGAIALAFVGISSIGGTLKLTGIGKFIDAIATISETSPEAGRELENLTIAFQSVTGSSALAADAMDYVSETAEKFGINIKSAEEAYLGLVATTRGTELEGFQTDQIFEAFAQTAALRGLDQQQQQQMFTAVQQVLGKGKLSAEEVRGQLGEIPALAFQQTLAEALGVNLQQLDKLLSTGKLQSDALFKVAQAYQSANAQMSGASETATAAITRMDNAIVKLQRAVGAEFLAVQTKGAKVFANALNGIADRIPTIVRIFNTGLILVLVKTVATLFASATAVNLLRQVLVTLANAIGKLLPILLRLATNIAIVTLAWEGLVAVLEMWLPGQSEAQKTVRKLSLEYQELAGSIESAEEAQKELGNTDLGSWLKNAAGWVFNLKERFLDAGDLGRAALFKGFQEIDRRANANNAPGEPVVASPWAARFASSAREEFAYAELTNAKSLVAEQVYVGAEAKLDNQNAISTAERMLEIQEQMVRARTIAAGLSAADADGLAEITNTLKELRVEYNKYLGQVSDTQRRNQEVIKSNKQAIDELVKIRLNPNLGDYARGQIDAGIDQLIAQSEELGEGQKELDAIVSRFEVTLADFATALKRGVERLANFREQLTNTINEERAKLLETGLGLGKGEQTIRLELDRVDFKELEQWIQKLRIESQKITQRLQDPILADQERNLREQADREGVEFGSAFLQRIVEENDLNVDAAQQLLELQNLQNQITEGEVQLQQQALQARQSVRDLTRSVQDFLRQLEQELAEITLQLQEQTLGLQQQLRRSQLQKTIVAGSTGLFGSITSSVQGFLDAAGEIAQKYLGQERRKLEFEQKKYDLSTRLRDFSEGLNGATEALAAFKNGLTGTSSAGGTTAAATTRGGGAGMTAQGGTVGVSGATAELLARIRSGEGDYTSINRGYAGDTPGGIPGLTNMTIAQVQALQKQGGAFAVGAYQFIPDTLEGAVSRSGIDRNRKFDKAAQDQLALELLFGGTARPHLTAYLTGKSDNLNAALSDISLEWAALLGPGGTGAHDGDSGGNWGSISVADLLPQVRAQVSASPDSGVGGSSTPVVSGEVAQAQSLASQILATEKAITAATEGGITIAVSDLITQGENTLEEINRTLKINTQNTGVNVTALDNEVRQYDNPDALRIAETQLRQQFSDLNIRLDTQKTAIEDGLRELQNIATTYPKIIESLRATGDPLDDEQANLLQNVVNLLQMPPEAGKDSPLEAAKAYLKQIEEIQGRVSEAYRKEDEYQTQKIRIDSENSRIATELGIAQTNRNVALELELGLQQARNNLISQIAEKEREFADRPEELQQELEILQRQYEQQKQTLQLTADRSLLDEVAFQTEIQTRLTEAQAAQAEGQFGDNGVFGFRATALREENALLQEQIRYEQEVLAIRERYRDPAQSGLLAQTLEQARQLNQVNLQNIDTQFKTLGETIAQTAETALATFFEDIFTGSKTAGEALRSLAQSILRNFAQIAAQNLTKSIFGSIRGGGIGGGGGFLSKIFGGGGGAASTATGFWGWADGGTIPNYADGGRVLPAPVAEILRELVPGVDSGFRREGTKAALGIFTPGEEILSLRTGEAQRYQLLKKSLGSNPLQSIMSGNFAYGGTVGINPDILTGDMGIRAPLVPVSSVLQMNTGRGASSGGGNVTINYEVKTPDANSFRRSQYQIEKDATVSAKRVLNRK